MSAMAVDLKDASTTPTTRLCDDWEGDNDPWNARNWPKHRKILSTIIICIIGFVTTMGASIYAPGHDQVKQAFGVSTTVSILPLSFYSLGLAFGPTISSPLSETFGRKTVYLLTLPLFDIFVIGSGFSQSIGALTVCRFFSGIFAAPGVSVASATIADYTMPSERAIPYFCYYTIPFVGSLIGPLIGGFVVESKGWRWTQWTILFFAAAAHPTAFYLRESYKPIVLQQKAKRLGLQGPSGPQRSLGETVKAFLTSTILRPLHMITTEPLVGLLCLYMGFQFALMYGFVVALPYIFSTVYHFNTSAQGLSFLGLLTGAIVAPYVLFAVDRLIYRPRYTRLRSDPDPAVRSTNLPPEERLLGAMYGSLVLPVGLLWFAWSARPSVHWICPIIAQAIGMLGSILIYVPCSFYLLEVYGSKYGASASGASSLSRYTLSATFPLFITPMYEKLGVAWATSLLAFIAMAMAPIPWVFHYFGPRLRARSAYEHGT